MAGAMTELGVSKRPAFGVLGPFEPDPKLRGYNGMKKFEEIRRDPTGAAMHLVLSLPLKKVEWACLPGGATAADEQAAEFAWTTFNDMSISFGDLVSEICTMFTYGWAWFEMVLKRRNGGLGAKRSQYDDGRVGFKKIALRPQASWRDWVTADDGDLKGMTQVLDGGEEVTIPLERSLLFRTTREGDNPEGFSIYRAAVRPYEYRKRLEQIEGVGLYRRWAGFPQVEMPAGATAKGEAPAGTSDEERAQQMIQDIYHDRLMGAYVPPGWKVTLGGPEGSVDRTMGDTIIRKDAEMARAVLAQWLLLGLKEVGTQALAGTMLDAFYDSIGAYLQIIAQEFNRYAIPYLFRYNQFPGLTAFPYLEYSNPRDLDLTAVGRFIGILAGRDLLTPDLETENFLRSLVPGMPPAPEEIVEERERPANPEQDEPEDPEETEGDGGGTGEQGLEGRRQGAQAFALAPQERAARYHALANRNARGLRQDLETWTGGAAEEIAGLGPEATEADLAAKIDDLVLAGLLLMRERSLADIAAGFWLGFGRSSGGSSQLMALQRETETLDAYMGYREGGEIRRLNPDGRGTLFGDIAGSLEGRIAAILLLLKQGREDEALLEVEQAVRAATQGFHRAELYAGHVWRGIWAGVGQREMEAQMLGQPAHRVRWVMDPFARHCGQCPILAREYDSWQAMVNATGGVLPGMGTDCDGNCRCHLEMLVNGVWVWM